MTDAIKGKVAKILSDNRLVINRGVTHGVELGMRFAILTEVGVDLVDPESGDSIGEVPIAKTIVKVISVHDRFSIARTFRSYQSSGVFAALTKSYDHSESIRTDEVTAEEEYTEEDAKVERGDAAVEIMEEEFDGLVLGYT